MRVVVLLLGVVWCVATAGRAQQDVASLLYEIADGEPTLATWAGLGKLAPGLHPVVLGLLVEGPRPDPINPQPREGTDLRTVGAGQWHPGSGELAGALTDFDERSAWALPVMVDAVRRPGTRRTALLLLRRLGDAAAPAVPHLQEVAADRTWQRDDRDLALGLVERLAPLAGKPVPAAALPPLPGHDDARPTTELLLALHDRDGAADSTALLALCARSDEAAFAALLELLPMVHVDATRRRASELLRLLRCVHRGRGALDTANLLLLPDAPRLVEMRRHVLACAPIRDPLDLERILALGTEHHRLLAARLALAGMAEDISRSGRVIAELRASADPTIREIIASARASLAPDARERLIAAMREPDPQRTKWINPDWRLDRITPADVPLLHAMLEGAWNQPFALYTVTNLVLTDPAQFETLLQGAGPRAMQAIASRALAEVSQCAALLPPALRLLNDQQLMAIQLHASLAPALWQCCSEPGLRRASLTLLERQTFEPAWQEALAQLPLDIGFANGSPPSERDRLLRLLSRVGDAATGAVVTFAGSGTADDQRACAVWLAARSTTSPQRTEVLLRILKGSDMQAAIHAAVGLQTDAAHRDAAMTRLVQIWQESGDEPRALIARVARRLGAGAAPLRALLTADLARADPGYATGLLWALLAIAPDDAGTIELLRERLRSEDPAIARAVWNTFDATAPTARRFLPEVTAALDHGDERCSWCAFRCLQQWPDVWPAHRAQIERGALANGQANQVARQILEAMPRDR